MNVAGSYLYWCGFVYVIGLTDLSYKLFFILNSFDYKGQ